MGKARRAGLAALAFWVALAAMFMAGTARSEVNVNINVGPPAVVVQEPPEVVVIPRTMVYFAPGVSVDLFFHRGYWWTPKEGRWFRSRNYRGPWVIVAPRYVPVEVVRVPRGYRETYIREEHVPYGQLKKHWEHRDRERRERRGEWKDWKEEKRERKEERKEEKRDRHEERGEHRRGD